MKRCAGTNLTFHNGVTNTFRQVGQFLCIFSIVEKTCGFPSHFQQSKVLERIFQFPENPALGFDLDRDNSLITITA